MSPTTATDGIIAAGAHNLLSEIFGKYEYNTINSQKLGKLDFNSLPDACFYPNEKFDAIVVLGTPWLWDQFYLSSKYINLMRAFDIHKQVRRVFLGVGSCLRLDDSITLKREQEAEHLQLMMGGGAINIVRDSLAKEALDNAGVESHLLHCPSYFCYGVTPTISIKSDTNILVWYNPLTGISNDYWQGNKENLDSYFDLIVSFYKAYNPQVYCAVNEGIHYEEDIKLTKKLGLPPPIILQDWEHTKKIMGDGKIILSGRVHCGVPAYVQRKQIGILPIDSRAKTLTDFGCQAITNISQFENINYEPMNLAKTYEAYRKLLEPLAKSS